MNETFHFQVNLSGMLDVLSNHLYKRTDVFLRELLQNSTDAITLRGKEHADWSGGEIIITVEERQRLKISDDGAGLTEEEIHRFLAVIGQSSKAQRTEGKMSEDYIGRFGIGLLSCFMVSDVITVHTRATGGSAYVWKGLADGTYTLTPLEGTHPIGTTVILEAKKGLDHFFTRKRVEELVRYYGLALPFPIYFQGEMQRLNAIPTDFTYPDQEQLLTFGTWLFNERFLEAIPIHTPHLDGIAYILPYETSMMIKGGHRIYLKQMLLTEQGDRLLPPWAFFLRCFLNTKGLRPTASREDFYEDGELEMAREEFAHAVSLHLERLQSQESDHLQRIVQVHVRALKSMAIWDHKLFHLFIDYLPFETSQGTLTGAALKHAGEAAYVTSVDKFRQLRPIFMAQGKLLICAGYTSDQELMEKMHARLGLPVFPLSEEALDTTLDEPTLDQREASIRLLLAANRGLREFECQAEVKGFLPEELPVLYSLNDEVRFLREIKRAHDTSNSIFSETLSFMLSGAEERPMSNLYLNLNCPLISRLCTWQDERLLESVIRMLYVQALLSGGYPLQKNELQVMNRELLHLIEQRSEEGNQR